MKSDLSITHFFTCVQQKKMVILLLTIIMKFRFMKVRITGLFQGWLSIFAGLTFHRRNLFFCCFFLLFLFSCVPYKQFEAVKEQNESLKTERDQLLAENEKLQVSSKELEAKLNLARNRLNDLSKDSMSIAGEIRLLEKQYTDVKRQYDELNKSMQNLLEGSTLETTLLLSELQKTQNDLLRREDSLNTLKGQIQFREQNLAKLTRELDERNRRMQELEKMILHKDSAVNALKNKISSALLGFENQGLSISRKNGKVYVSLDEKLLFKTGSTQVDDNGKRALRSLARVLEQNPDIIIMIEGHTDNVPYISGSTIKDNWDLSVLRATSIVRIILENSSIDPERLIATGRGEFLPVDPGDTPEARQKNRRTEIILYPKLDELYELMNEM